MIRALPYFLAGSVGIWVCVPLAHVFSLAVMAMISGGIAGSLLAYGFVATRLDNRLSNLDKIAIADARVQQRLTDALATRRSRLTIKRATLFSTALVAMIAPAALKMDVPSNLLIAAILLSMCASWAGTIGAILLFFEGASVDARANEIYRYAERLKLGTADALKLQNAKSAVPKAPNHA